MASRLHGPTGDAPPGRQGQEPDMRDEMETLAAPEEGLPGPAIGQDGPASCAGSPARADAVVAALRTVHDPEIPVNIYDLGLIYRVGFPRTGVVDIDMTLTAPGCPVAGEMLNWVRDAVSAVAGVDRVEVRLVFEPPWDQSKMSEEAKLELGLL
jgi:FeS assembly SUF system protein